MCYGLSTEHHTLNGQTSNALLTSGHAGSCADCCSTDDPHEWVYRNTAIHLKVKEVWTTAAHETILEIMEGFLQTDLEQLLYEHSIYSSQTLLLLHCPVLVLLRTNLSGYLKWIMLLEQLRRMWLTVHAMRCGCGIAAATIPGCRQSTRQLWWMQKGVCSGVDATHGLDGISVSLMTTFPNSLCSRLKVVKHLAYDGCVCGNRSMFRPLHNGVVCSSAVI